MRKARYFEANSPLVQRIADLWEQYTVGPNGLIITPASKDEAWVQRAKEWFDEWALAPDLCSLNSWTTLQSLIARLWLVDGEVFILKTRTLEAPYRPRIQIIESHRVGTPNQFAALEGKTFVDGVQIDLKGRPVTYWVRDGFEATEYVPIPASNILHICEPTRVGMYRCLSHFYAVMNSLHDLDDLMHLEMQAAKDAAHTEKIVKTASGEMPDDDWSEAQEVATVNSQPNIDRQKQYYERIFGAETKVLFHGDEYAQFVSNRPSVAQQWYWKFLAEQVCSGVGIPLLMVYPDTMQGTVYRGMLDTAAGFFRARSRVLADAFAQVWLYAINFGASYDVRIADRPTDWKSTTMRPPKAANVDVGRNSTAMLAELEAGTRTFADIYGEMGDDWREKLAQRATEAAYIKKLAKKNKINPQAICGFAPIEGQGKESAQQPIGSMAGSGE